MHDIGRRGKFLVVELIDGRALVCHLRMTGWFHHVSEPVDRPYLRALFGLDDGRWLLYCDQRRFGTMRLFQPGELETYWSGRLAPSRSIRPGRRHGCARLYPPQGAGQGAAPRPASGGRRGQHLRG